MADFFDAKLPAEGVHDIVDEITLTIGKGEVLGLVGESGSGKTTVGLAVLGHARKGVAVNTGSVTIDDTTPTQGDTLTASNTLADADGLGAITYTWKADGSVVGTGTTYDVTEAEVGKVITVEASYTDGHGTPELVSSATTSAVANVNDAPTGSVTIDDTTPTQGQTLTVSNTLADVDGLGAITLSTGAFDPTRREKLTGILDRSPCGTGTSAKLACLFADGKLKPGDVWRQESITGSRFEAWLAGWGKEIEDAFSHGDESWEDLDADRLGRRLVPRL